MAYEATTYLNHISNPAAAVTLPLPYAPLQEKKGAYTKSCSLPLKKNTPQPAPEPAPRRFNKPPYFPHGLATSWPFYELSSYPSDPRLHSSLKNNLNASPRSSATNAQLFGAQQEFCTLQQSVAFESAQRHTCPAHFCNASPGDELQQLSLNDEFHELQRWRFQNSKAVAYSPPAQPKASVPKLRLANRNHTPPPCFCEPVPAFIPKDAVPTLKHKRTRRGRRGGKNRRRYQVQPLTPLQSTFTADVRAVPPSDSAPNRNVAHFSTKSASFPFTLTERLNASFPELQDVYISEKKEDTRMNSSVVASVLHDVLETPRPFRGTTTSAAFQAPVRAGPLGVHYRDSCSSPKLNYPPHSLAQWKHKLQSRNGSSVTNILAPSSSDAFFPFYAEVPLMQNDLVTAENEKCSLHANKKPFFVPPEYKSLLPPSEELVTFPQFPQVLETNLQSVDAYDQWLSVPFRNAHYEKKCSPFAVSNESSLLRAETPGGTKSVNSCRLLSSSSTQSTNSTEEGDIFALRSPPCGPLRDIMVAIADPMIEVPTKPENIAFFPSFRCHTDKAVAVCTMDSKNTSAQLLQALSRQWDTRAFQAH